METFRLKIKGVSPLLLHGFSADFGVEDKVAVKKKNQDYGSPRDQMERHIYTDDKGLVWMPSSAVMGALRGVASDYKLPGARRTLKGILGGVVIMMEEKMYFTKKIKKEHLEVDSRPVCIQGSSRIMRHRGRLEEWEMHTSLMIDTETIQENTIHEILNVAGKRVGIGDFRPQCHGPFGRFQVSFWERVAE